MTFLRAWFLLSIVAASTCAFAADDGANSSGLPFVRDSSPSFFAKPSSRPTPWFSGMPSNPNLKFSTSYWWRLAADSGRLLLQNGYRVKIAKGPTVTVMPGLVFGNVCLTIRTYKAKRTERLADNDSGMRGYSTCQMASNYQVRTAVGREVLQVPEQ